MENAHVMVGFGAGLVIGPAVGLKRNARLIAEADARLKLPMPRNIEIKARIDNIETLEGKVAGIADSGPTDIDQDDTFFNCAHGRLKLRTYTENSGELIFYQRADESGPKESFYQRSETPSPSTLREALGLACGTAGRVRKHRRLYLVGRTRVHLDRVEGLGDFLELEVVLGDNEAPERGIEEARSLLRQLAVEDSQLLQGAYVDLLDQTERLRPG